jgi:hypothetical protein
MRYKRYIKKALAPNSSEGIFKQLKIAPEKALKKAVANGKIVQGQIRP